jgi:hypothetical protein
MALSGTQWHSEALRGTQRQSEAITVAIRGPDGTRRRSEAITCNHMQSVAIKGNQWQSEDLMALGDAQSLFYAPHGLRASHGARLLSVHPSSLCLEGSGEEKGRRGES